MSELSKYLEHIDYNPHIAFKLFRLTIMQKATHLYAADILSAAIPDTEWPKTRFQHDLKNNISSFLRSITGIASTLPDHSYAIATHPISQGGYGIIEPYVNSVPSLLTPIARCIRMVKQSGYFTPSRGLLDDIDRLELTAPSRFHVAGYEDWLDWEDSPTHLFHTFRQYAERFVTIPSKFADANPDTTKQQFLTECDLRKEIPRLKHRHHRSYFNTLVQTLPDDIKETIPLRLNTITSLAVTSVTTSHTPYVLHPDLLNIALRRKLILPLHEGPLTKCVCGETIDRRGEHFFKCNKLSKTPLHNTCRDAFTDIVKGLGEYIGIDTPEIDVTREQEGLLTSTPTIRPGDFSIINGDSRRRLSMIHAECTCHGVGKKQSVFSIVTNDLLSQYERTENVKFDFYHRGGQQRSGLREMNRKQHALIPIVFDQYGNLGPFAERFLHGKKVRGIENRDVTGLPREESRNLLERTASEYCMNNILGRANIAFIKDHSAPKTFSPIVNARMPSDWAIQHLSVNMTHALSCHIRRAQKLCYKKIAQTQQLKNYSLYPAEHYRLKGHTLQSLERTAKPVVEPGEV